ncbi:MAG: primosomal protein N' [Chloroflexi bacterium]|nr:primosomal protein N' [Chloroflexota bacterium]
MPYAEVAVNAAAPLRQTFTYRIPDDLNVSVGLAVYVPFGTRTLQGIVMEVTEIPAFAEARDLTAVIDPDPMLSSSHVATATWMSEHYLAPLFDCVSLMLPSGFKRRPITILSPLATTDELEDLSLPERQKAVFSAVIDAGEIELEALKRPLNISGVASAIAALVKRGVLQKSYRLARPAGRPKVVAHLKSLVSQERLQTRIDELRSDGGKGALRRAEVLAALLDEGQIPLSQARSMGLTAAARRDLEAEGLVAVEDVTVVRDPLAGRSYDQRSVPDLTPDQTSSYREIVSALDRVAKDGRGASFLLEGVTGSGKTEVYLAALDHAVSLGKRAIALVPEISLTPQTVRRFGERFPGKVAVMHSGLSIGEHFDMWHEVRAGKYQVVIGPRGALFAPMPDVGLIIIDEEHEWTYKQQEGSPRYHARRAAVELCRHNGAVLVLGSATPDVESRFHAGDGRIRHLRLPDRLIKNDDGSVVPGPLPEVEVVDLREELKAGNRSIFSRALYRSMEEVLESREQMILFLNRRGSASFMQCRDCGFVPECRSCAVSLTYHEPDSLVCHYCRRTQQVPGQCAECESKRIRTVGLGTERVEEEVKQAFPSARTVRWDRDVTRGRGSHEAILARFVAHDADVLIGTQMVAKGLDIPLVTLVGVISADVALHLPDFRSGERTFQILEQVAGRAGRGSKGGRVIIQTYTPEHYAVEAAAAHSYDTLYDREIESRQRLGYPPFGRLVQLTFAHTGESYAQEQAAKMTHRLKSARDRLGTANLDILGPAPAFVSRIRGRWRWNVLLRGNDPTVVLRDEPLPVGWTVDVDPVSLI